MGNILVLVGAVGFEFLAKMNPNVASLAKFRNYNYAPMLYAFIEQQVERFKLKNIPYIVPGIIAGLLIVIALVGHLLFGKVFSLLVLFYAFRQLPHEASDNAFVEFNERYFANLLYYALFGSFAVLLYNFVAIARIDHKELSKVHAVLAWVPARLAAFSFALVGKFMPVFKVWFTSVANMQITSSQILTECGQAGADGDENSVAERALIAWAVVCVVILTLIV